MFPLTQLLRVMACTLAERFAFQSAERTVWISICLGMHHCQRTRNSSVEIQPWQRYPPQFDLPKHPTDMCCSIQKAEEFFV